MKTHLPYSQIPVFFEDTAIAFSSQTNAQLRKTYWLFRLMNQARVVNLGTFFIKVALKLHLPVKNIIRATVFEQFCGGETISDCKDTIHGLGSSKIGTILDYSVEGEDTEENFEFTTNEILLTIEQAAESKYIPYCVFKISGIGSSILLANIQRNKLLDVSEHASFARLEKRVETLCQKAYDLNVRIFIDAEESWIQRTIDLLAYQMMEKYNKKRAIVYNTYQFYQLEALNSFKSAYLQAKKRGFFLGAKLVRGAYMEKERIRAHKNNYTDPIHSTKEDTDQHYNEGIDFALEHIQIISQCLGTHNEYSIQYCAYKMAKFNISKEDPRVWFAQLLGMSDNISYNLSNAGYNVAKYVPYGPIKSVIPYLIRRADENTAIAGQSSREYLLVKRELKRRGIRPL